MNPRRRQSRQITLSNILRVTRRYTKAANLEPSTTTWDLNCTYRLRSHDHAGFHGHVYEADTALCIRRHLCRLATAAMYSYLPDLGTCKYRMTGIPISSLDDQSNQSLEGSTHSENSSSSKKTRSSCIVSSISQLIYMIHFPPTTRLPITPPRSSSTKSTTPLHRLALFHIGMSNGIGAASCLFATTHPFSPTSRLQHDQRKPQAKASYSISVHASPCKYGSKFSQTSCEGWTSRSPVWYVSLGYGLK